MTQVRYRGRTIGAPEIEQVRALIEAHPGASRWVLSRRLCEAWSWRQPNGVLQDMVARGLMLTLHRAGHIELPPLRRTMPNPLGERRKPEHVTIDPTPVRTELASLRPLEFRLVRRTPEERVFNGLIEEHHYLGYTQPVGAHLKYMVYAQGRPLACLAWSSAPRHLGPRFIGWSPEARRRNIRFVAYNPRFLVLPWVEIPHLASHILGRVVRRLSADWQQVYDHPLFFVETFVDPSRYRGTCYRAANWVVLGETTGRGKDDITHRAQPTDQAGPRIPALKALSGGAVVPTMTAAPKPRRIEVTLDELERVLERSQKGPLCESDRQVLADAIKALGCLADSLRDRETTIADLRRLFRMAPKTEKLSNLFPPEQSGAPTPDGSEPTAESGSPPAVDAPPAGAEAADPEPEPKRKGHGRNGAEDHPGAQRCPVPHESLRAGELCPSCGKGRVYPLEPATVIEFTGHPPIQVKVHELERLRCNLCGESFTAATPEGVSPEKYDATAASMIALLRYGTGLPFKRLEGLERNLGVLLPASTQWEVAHNLGMTIEPVWQALLRSAAQATVIHNDDTSIKVLDVGKRIREGTPDDSGVGTHRTGIFTSGIVATRDERRIALFLTGRRHAGENLARVLALRERELDPPILMCDALDRNLPGRDFDVIVANCLAHGRRHFVDQVGNFPEEVRYVLETLREVYRVDAEAKHRRLDPQQRLAYHQENSSSLMRDLELWFDTQLRERRVEPNSGLGKAMQYMRNHWAKLTQFLTTPGAPLDNNLCERALKKAILHRRNSLYYRTERGARIGDIFMSLIHTCELNQINAFEYLSALARNPRQLAQDPARWLPWCYPRPDP